MKVKVLFFGATADAAGARHVEVAAAPGATARTVVDDVLSRFPRLNDHKLLFALNEEYTNGEEPVAEGDELAVFTAVSGG